MSKRTCKESRTTELTLQEAAMRLGIDPATAYRWAVSGKLEITTRVPRSQPRILVSESSVSKLLEGVPA